jgi:periplasmic protein TonB
MKYLWMVLILLTGAFNTSAQEKDTSGVKVKLSDHPGPLLYVSPLKVAGSDSGRIYEYVDEFPEYPGGLPAYQDFIKKNIKFPPGFDGEGTLYIRITVMKDGSMHDAKIVKDPLGHNCGEEALRVVRLMPKWKPGKVNGSPVNCHYTIPFKFVRY